MLIASSNQFIIIAHNSFKRKYLFIVYHMMKNTSWTYSMQHVLFIWVVKICFTCNLSKLRSLKALYSKPGHKNFKNTINLIHKNHRTLNPINDSLLTNTYFNVVTWPFKKENIIHIDLCKYMIWCSVIPVYKQLHTCSNVLSIWNR